VWPAGRHARVPRLRARAALGPSRPRASSTGSWGPPTVTPAWLIYGARVAPGPSRPRAPPTGACGPLVASSTRLAHGNVWTACHLVHVRHLRPLVDEPVVWALGTAVLYPHPTPPRRRASNAPSALDGELALGWGRNLGAAAPLVGPAGQIGSFPTLRRAGEHLGAASRPPTLPRRSPSAPLHTEGSQPPAGGASLCQWHPAWGLPARILGRCAAPASSLVLRSARRLAALGVPTAQSARPASPPWRPARPALPPCGEARRPRATAA